MTPADDETIALKRAADGGTSVYAHVPRELGPVRLIREIGRGGMGEVWLGRHSLLARDVAVKFLLRAVQGPDDPHFEQFLQEARTAAAVRHPHLVIVHDANVTGQVPYLVLEYIDGPTLAEVLRRRGVLGVSETLAVLEAVAGGVGELHERGIVHRDIKPSNVLLDRDGRIVVSDFGLACAAASRAEGPSPRAVAGTPAYMAPEMFDGESSPRSDVYALGIMAFQLLVGNLPFAGSFEDLRSKHMNEPLPLEQLPGRGEDGALVEIVERATHKNAMFRFKSAGALLRALKQAVPDVGKWSRGLQVLASLAAPCVPTPGEGGVEGPRTPRLPSYYEHLASIAATKRQGTTDVTDAAACPSLTGHGRIREFFTLKKCPQCEYDLAGLPARHRCPECGFDYDESMFVVYGWIRKQDRPNFWRRTTGTSSPLLGVPVGLLLLYLMVKFATQGAWRRAGILLVCILIGIARWHSARRTKALRGGTMQYAFSSLGASQRRGAGEARFIPWHCFRQFRFRRLKRDLWRFRMSRGRWPFRLYLSRNAPRSILGGPWIEGVIECDRRQAAALRGEIRRRMAAHAQPRVRTAGRPGRRG